MVDDIWFSKNKIYVVGVAALAYKHIIRGIYYDEFYE